MTLEMVARLWCYAFGTFAALGVLGAVMFWALDKMARLFKVTKAITDWAYYRARGYEIYKPKIVTHKAASHPRT